MEWISGLLKEACLVQRHDITLQEPIPLTKLIPKNPNNLFTTCTQSLKFHFPIHILGSVNIGRGRCVWNFFVVLYIRRIFLFQPIKNYREWKLAYFIPFLMLGGFLVLNMIVGVVVENFQRCRERLEDEEKQRGRRKLLEKAREKSQEGKFNFFFWWPWQMLGVFIISLQSTILRVLVCPSILVLILGPSFMHHIKSLIHDSFTQIFRLFFCWSVRPSVDHWISQSVSQSVSRSVSQ